MKIFFYWGTHWDREWYQTFQGFRKRLVDMVDELIEELETNEEFGVFHFDGQTIVLEDYLEIRPEMKDRLSALIAKGKIIIGPWYNMPDEFLVSGESLIQNLRLGKKICEETYGVKAGNNAYICDIFGHSSQTPQIFNGMGYYNTVLGRGTNEHTEPAHFVWEALDGSQVCTYKLRDDNGYGDFTQFYFKNKADELTDEQLAALLQQDGRYPRRAGRSAARAVGVFLPHPAVYRKGFLCRSTKGTGSAGNRHHLCDGGRRQSTAIPTHA